MKILQRSLIPLAALLVAAGARAQEAAPMRISAGAGYERSVIDNEINAFVTIRNCNCPTEQNGVFTGYHVDAAFSYPLASWADLALRAGYARMVGAFEVVYPDATVLLEDQAVPVNMTIVGRINMTLAMLRFDLTTRARLPLGLSAELGLTAGRRWAPRLRSSHELVKPTNARFMNPNGLPTENDGRTIIFYDSAWTPENPFMLGGIIGISRPIPLFEGFEVIPEIMLREVFTPLGGEVAKFPSFYGSAGISLAYTFGGGPEMAMAEPPREEPERLSVELDLYSLDESGARIPEARVDEGRIDYRRQIIPLTALYFARGAASIPERYLARSGDREHHATHDSIARMAPEEAYYHLLDMVGQTMAMRPGARMILHGGGAAGEPDGIGRERAESVARLLAERWRIDGKSILVADDEREPMVRIEYEEVAHPELHGAWSERFFTTTPIKADPAVIGDGVKDWSITFRQNGRLLARQGSDGASEGELSVAMMMADMKSGSVPPPLEVELAAEDSAGRRISTRSTLPFARSTRAAGTDSIVQTYHYLDAAKLFGDGAMATLAGFITIDPTRDVTIIISPLFPAPASMAAERSAQLEEIARGLRAALAGTHPELPADAVRIVETPACTYTGLMGLPEERALLAGVEVEVRGRKK